MPPAEAPPRSATAEPRVTVLLPVRNGAGHVGAAVDSILAQTFVPLELLAVDDGSDDETPGILDRYARRDPRVRVLSQPPSGLIKTLNRGLREARTELIARQDADDLSEPTRIAAQVAYLDRRPDVALVGTSATVIDEHGASSAWDAETEHEKICDGLLLGNMFAHGSVMLRRSAALEVGAYRDEAGTHYVEDYDLWIRMARRFRVANLPQPLYRYRSSPTGVSRLRAEEQARNAKRLIAELSAARGYRDFWSVPGYSRRRWALGGTDDAGRGPTGNPEERLRRDLAVIRLLWSLGEPRAASWRLAAMIRRHPAALGALALGRLAGRGRGAQPQA